MTDVTHLISRYRECVRHLYNTYFWQEVTAGEEPDCNLADLYFDIASQLFDAVVLYKLDVVGAVLTPAYRCPQIPLEFLRVKPDDSALALVMVNREQDSGYWDLEVTDGDLREAVMNLLGFFDFESYGFSELRYYRVLIQSTPARSDLAGRHALVPVDCARVYFDAEAAA